MTWLRRWGPILFLCVAPLLVLWPCLSGTVPGAFNSIATMQPWGHAPVTGETWDVLSADGALQFYAWRDLVFEGWHTGQIPLWNPYQFCGTPLLANSQSAPFYPLHILVGLLGLPTGGAMVVLAWFHLAVAGLGARFLARALGASDGGSTLAGFFFGTSLFLSAWAALPSVGTTVCWVPWAMGCALTMTRRANVMSACGLAASVAMSFLGGHLQFSAYGLLGTAVVAVAGLVIAPVSLPQKGGALVGGLLACALGLAVASVQVVPALQFSKLSHRQSKPTAEGWAAYSKSAVQPWEISGIAFPQVLGVPHQAEEDSPVQGLSRYWPALVKPGAHLAESAVAVAFPALVLLALVRWRRDFKSLSPAIVLAAVGLLLATGVLAAPLYFGVPGWSATGSPGRASFLWVLGICVAAALGWPASEEKTDWRISAGVAGALALLTFVMASANSNLIPWLANAPVSQLVSRRLIESAPLVVLGAGICIGAVFALSKNRMAALVALVAAHALAVLTMPIPTGNVPYQKQAPDATKRYAFINGSWGLIGVPKAVMPPDTATSQRMLDVAGYDSLIDRASVERLRGIDRGKDPAPPANGNIMHVHSDFDPVKLADAGVSEVWSRTPIAAQLPVVEQTESLTKYRLDGKRFDYQGSVTKAEDRLDGLVLEVEGSGPLTVKDHMMEGWACQVDGQVVPIGTPWRTVETGTAGKHRVEFRYRPAGFGTGVAFSSLGIAALTVLSAVAWILKLKASQAEPVKP